MVKIERTAEFIALNDVNRYTAISRYLSKALTKLIIIFFSSFTD